MDGTSENGVRVISLNTWTVRLVGGAEGESLGDSLGEEDGASLGAELVDGASLGAAEYDGASETVGIMEIEGISEGAMLGISEQRQPLVGTMLGSWLGAEDSEGIAERVGEVLGAGDSVGVSDGDRLGILLGAEERLGIMEMLGMSLGAADSVGPSVGSSEGSIEGIADGGCVKTTSPLGSSSQTKTREGA